MIPYAISSETPQARRFEEHINALPSGKLITYAYMDERVKISSKAASRYFKELVNKGVISAFGQMKDIKTKKKHNIYVKN